MSKWIGYLINGLVALAVGISVCFVRGITSAETTKDVLRILCDAFFLPGALYLGMGGLTWASNGGVMDGLSYAFKSLIQRMRPNYEQERVSYYEYKQERRNKAKSPKEQLLVGAVFTAISLILLFFYNRVA